jgi:hypothetical protein
VAHQRVSVYLVMSSFLDEPHPIGGTIKEVRVIQSDDAAGGIISWDSKNKKYVFDANTPG